MHLSVCPAIYFLRLLIQGYSFEFCQVGGTDASEASRETTAGARRRVGEGEIKEKTRARAAADPPEDAGR